MTIRRFSCLLCLALGACATRPPAPPAAPPVVAVAPAPVPAAPPDEVGPLLDYRDQLQGMGAADLLKQLNELERTAGDAGQTMRMALVLMQGRSGAELARAQGALDAVLASGEPQALRLKPLARLLAAQCADLRRNAEQTDKLNHQLKESQRRADQLNEIVTSLKAIERMLPARPAGPQPAAPPVPAAGAAK